MGIAFYLSAMNGPEIDFAIQLQHFRIEEEGEIKEYRERLEFTDRCEEAPSEWGKRN